MMAERTAGVPPATLHSAGTSPEIRQAGRLRYGAVLLAAFILALSGCEKDKRSEEAAPNPAPAAPAEASGGHLQRVTAAKVLRVGVRSDVPPFCFQDKDGNPQGFDVDLGYRLARGLGVQPVFVTLTGAERIERLKKNDVDVVIATLTATRRRAREIDFSIPYFQDQQSLLVKTDSALQSYRDLGGKRVAAALGTTSIDNIKTVAPQAEVVSVNSPAEGFEKLKAGEVDAVTGDGLQLQALRINSGQPDSFRIAGEGFSVEPYVIGLPRNDSEFRNRVDEILTELWNKGAWTRLFNKWLGAQSPYNLEAHFQMPVLPP